MLVARVLATVSSVGEIPIQVTNLTNKALTLFKGQNLGFIDEAEDADAPIEESVNSIVDREPPGFHQLIQNVVGVDGKKREKRH
jgi:hypothetical protein